MRELNFNSGIESFSVNGVENALRFNPTDIELLRKIYVSMKDLEAKQKERNSAQSDSDDIIDTLNKAKQLDTEMRGIIDGVFGDGLCNKIFGDVSLYASADGFPVWQNFILAVIDLFDEATKREAALSNEKIQKYVKKYHK